MEINQSANYKISRNGEIFGPYPGSHLFELAQNRQIYPSDFLWTDGMNQWEPTGSFAQIVSILDSHINQPSQSIQHSLSEITPALEIIPPTQTPGNMAGPSTLENIPSPQRPRTSPSLSSKFTPRKGASFGVLLFAMILFFSALFGPSIFVLIMTESDVIESESLLEKVLESQIVQNEIALWSILALILFAILFFPVLCLIYVYRGWKCLQDLPSATISPAAAVGFHFIPIFNLVWIFYVYVSWAKNYNIRKNLAPSQSAPHVNESLFLVHCILYVIGIPILYPVMMYQMCRGINYLAESPRLN